MKKILFYFNNYCSEYSQGGTEVATYRIAKALKDTGKCEVYHVYHNSCNLPAESIYSATALIPKSPSGLITELADFIKNKDIGYVVVMSRFFKFNNILKAVKLSGKHPKIFFMQHFAPGSEKKKTTYSASWHLLKLNPFRPKYYLRTLFYPLLKMPRTLRWKKVYRETYKNSDKVILLSEGYKKDYSRMGGFSDTSKFVAIPNIFEISGPGGPIKEMAEKKEKRVLILSRMDELQKRISLALKIWKKIEEDPDLNDWRLDIVGDGNNTDIVRRMISKMGLRNVTLHGWQKREPFLQRSSILMMTSEYEGLPLSILEAQAYGVVPIAFNSFASLKDVIYPFTNGVIVDKFGDIDGYVLKLKDLMYNADYRNDLAKTTPSHINKFSPETVADQWLKILT